MIPLLQDLLLDGHLEDMCKVYAKRERELMLVRSYISDIISSEWGRKDSEFNCD